MKMYYFEKENKKRLATGGRTLRTNRNPARNCKSSDSPIILPCREKLKAMFLKADKDGNGWLEEAELQTYLNELSVQFPDITNISFQDAFKEGRICFEDFYKRLFPFMESHPHNIENEQQADGSEDDEENEGIHRSDSVSVIKRQLFNQESPGLRKLLQRTISQIESQDELIRSNPVANNDARKKEIYNNTYTSEEEENIHDYIEQRWKAFINFRRRGKDGEIVMTSDEKLTDALPGSYDLLQLVMDQFDSSIISSKPNHTVLKPVKWISSAKGPGSHGQLLCPKYWKCTIPIEIGTEQNLSYYGCCYASTQQQKVALLHRHATVDFVYSENYKRNYVLQEEEGSGGCGIEMHAFHHMDCPLDDNSGYFLLGKFVSNDELHITAFKIPKYHVLYVPPMVIHSNDHMLGKWRTMLADNVPIDHVHFMKETELTGYYDNVNVIIEEVK